MTSATGSFSMTGLLGGTAGQIDVTGLIAQLMTAASVPQQQLQRQLTTETTELSTYQAINSRLAGMLSAGQHLTDSATWSATSASSSNSSVVATSSPGAPLGTATFTVDAIAQAQVSTIQADASGNVLSSGTTSIQIDGTTINAATGSASDVAAAINSSAVGVTANVVTADNPSGGTMQLLQLTSSKVGSANAFTIGQTGLANASQDIVAAQDAQISVGGSTGYTVSSTTNSFSNVIPGVTFSVSTPGVTATITVGNNEQAVSSAVAALVNAANMANSEIGNDTAQGATLAANSSVESIGQSILSTVSRGTSTGSSYNNYGITIDKNGVMSFDATAFAAAYNADPSGTQQVINTFASSLNSVATAATDPTYGSITTTMQQIATTSSHLTSEIGTWSDRLSQIKDQYTTKFTAMETALAGLQSQQTYLTNMFNAMNKNNSSSS